MLRWWPGMPDPVQNNPTALLGRRDSVKGRPEEKEDGGTGGTSAALRPYRNLKPRFQSGSKTALTTTALRPVTGNPVDCLHCVVL